MLALLLGLLAAAQPTPEAAGLELVPLPGRPNLLQLTVPPVPPALTPPRALNHHRLGPATDPRHAAKPAPTERQTAASFL